MDELGDEENTGSFDRIFDKFFRTLDNDKYKDIDKEKIDNRDRAIPLNEEISIRSFIPNNSAESRCLDLAQKLGETDMRFILSAYRRCGLPKVEEAYGITMETKKVRDRRKEFIQRFDLPV